jgi:hypothetical protein
MTVKLNFELDQLLASGQDIVLELGCGQSKKAGRIGIDILDLNGVDMVGDAVDCLQLFPDRSISEIHSKSFLAHVQDLELVVRETARVLKKDANHYLYVPHFSNPYYYSDYTHRHFMGLYTFYYFVNSEHQLTRKVPSFYTDTRIKISSQKLIFTSPFIGRWGFKKFLQILFNSSKWMQEFYEENLCYIFPCYAIEVVYSPDIGD